MADAFSKMPPSQFPPPPSRWQTTGFHAGLYYYTKDEKPGRGALDLAILFMTICVPLRLTTALLPSWSDSVKEEYPLADGTTGLAG